jgi:hypothetical protein
MRLWSLSARTRSSARCGQFQGVNVSFQAMSARFDGLESEPRFRFEQLDRLEERMDEVIARRGALEKTGGQRHAQITAQLEKLLARPFEN